MDRDDQSASVMQAQHLECSLDRIDEPHMLYAGTCVDRELLRTIVDGRRPREGLADPVGGDGEERLVRNRWKPLHPPSRQIWDHDVLAQMQLGLVEDDPSSRTASATSTLTW